jgi:rhamnogalacturonyl hydrolase YesR
MVKNQKWIDGFHTAYNLQCLYEYGKYTQDNSCEENFKKGLNYYMSNFFTEEGVPKYYNHSLYPIDIHSTAQALILLSKTGLIKKKEAFGQKLLKWTIDNMQSEEGYFYYQIKRHYKINIPYMRWAQAWMFYALSFFIKETKKKEPLHEYESQTV